MLTVRSLNGEYFAAEAQVPRTRIIGEREISLSFQHSDINDEFLSDIETGWTAEFQGDEYWLYNPQEDKHGNKSFEGLLDFVRQGNKIWHIDDVENKSMTIQNSIGPLIDGMPDYTLNIIDNFYANTMSYSNRQTTTERFLYFIRRHDAEFDIPIGSKTIRVVNAVGTYRDDLLIHEDDNLLDFQLDTQSASFCTSVVGYYDFDEEGIPQKSVKFTSELSKKYGDIPGEPILDDRYNDEDSVYEAAKKRQEASFNISFSVSSELFNAPVNPGDYVPVVLPSKNINMYIRAVEVNELFDEEGELINATYSFGNENIANLYRKAQYDALQDVADMLRGKKPLPPSVFPKKMRQAYEIIIGDNDSVMEYRKDRLTGYHDKDKGNAVEMNVSGLVFIRGGEPRSAITYEGVVTEALTAGTIDTNRIRIVGAEGFFYIDGDELFAASYENKNKWFKLSPKDGLILNRLPTKWLAFDGREFIVNGIMRGQVAAGIQAFAPDTVEQDNRNVYYDLPEFERMYVIHDQYWGRYLDLWYVSRLTQSSRSASAHVTVRVTEVGTGVEIYRERTLVSRGAEHEAANFRPRIDLQSFFGVVPDYRKFSFYVEIMFESSYSGNKAAYRLNTGWFNG